jgi:hypothetical protein
MTLYILYAALALLGPYAIFKCFHGSQKVIERCEGIITCISLLDRSRSAVTPYELFNVQLANGKSMILEVSKARAARLNNISVKAMVTISQQAFGGPYISSVRYPGDTVDDAGDTKPTGLYLGVTYLMLGLFAACFSVTPSVYAELGHAGVLFSGLLIFLAGYAIGKFHMKPVSMDVQSSMLFGLIKLGSGRLSFMLMTAIACFLTIACFWFGGLGILLGFNIGCAAGMLVALALKPMRPATNVAITNGLAMR